MRCGQQKVKRFDYQFLHRYIDIYSFDSLIDFKVSFFFLLILSILLFKGLSLVGFLIFQFKNTPTLLCLSRDKTKGQSGKNTTLTPTKTLSKKQGHSSVIYFLNSPINFQITLHTYKLDSQNKKKIYIYKMKIKFLFCYKILNRTTKIKLKKSLIARAKRV